jgi:hypothetical protein
MHTANATGLPGTPTDAQRHGTNPANGHGDCQAPHRRGRPPVRRCICLLSAPEGSYRDRHASFTVNGLTDMAPTIKPAQALNAIINVGDQDRLARCGYAGPRVERASPFGIPRICVRLHGLANFAARIRPPRHPAKKIDGRQRSRPPDKEPLSSSSCPRVPGIPNLCARKRGSEKTTQPIARSFIPARLPSASKCGYRLSPNLSWGAGNRGACRRRYWPGP